MWGFAGNTVPVRHFFVPGWLVISRHLPPQSLITSHVPESSNKTILSASLSFFLIFSTSLQLGSCDGLFREKKADESTGHLPALFPDLRRPLHNHAIPSESR
jgi:hypothetical protein